MRAPTIDLPRRDGLARPVLAGLVLIRLGLAGPVIFGLLLGVLLGGCAPPPPAGQPTVEEIDAFFLPLIKAARAREAEQEAETPAPRNTR